MTFSSSIEEKSDDVDAKPKFANVKDGRVRGWERRFLPARNTIRVISIVVFKEDVRSSTHTNERRRYQIDRIWWRTLVGGDEQSACSRRD